MHSVFSAEVISVIICTHNPLPHFIKAVLQALHAQTLPKDQWELVLVDNLSQPPLADSVDLSWHPQARIFVEKRVGLTYARWGGFTESRGDVIVYVDDDNVLNPDYLEEAQRIAKEHPLLGTWGGQVLMQFDTPPQGDENLYTKWQLHNEFSKAKWLNFFYTYSDTPPGAGLVARRPVLQSYVGKLASDPLRQKLGRSGMGGGCREDTDIVLTGLELGSGMGQFPSLVLKHLTPASRLTRAYCLRQAYSLGYSSVILNRIWGIAEMPEGLPWLTRVREFYQFMKSPPLSRATRLESKRGHRDALVMLREFDAAKPGA